MTIVAPLDVILKGGSYQIAPCVGHCNLLWLFKQCDFCQFDVSKTFAPHLSQIENVATSMQSCAVRKPQVSSSTGANPRCRSWLEFNEWNSIFVSVMHNRLAADKLLALHRSAFCAMMRNRWLGSWFGKIMWLVGGFYLVSGAQYWTGQMELSMMCCKSWAE